MEKVVDTLYEISNTLHSVINGSGTFKDNYFYFGKKYAKIEDIPDIPVKTHNVLFEQKDNNGITIGGGREDKELEKLLDRDYGHPDVDIEITKYLYEDIIHIVENFYNMNSNQDHFTFLVGCTLNLYYSSGLYDKLGRFNINDILTFIEDKEVRNYILFEENYIYSNIFNFFRYLCDKKIFADSIELLNEYSESSDLQRKIELIEHIVAKIDDNCYAVKEFVKCVLKEYEQIKLLKEPSLYLEDMIKVNPKFQFANMYKCISAVNQYFETKGEDISFIEYSDILDEYLLKIAFGIKRPSSFRGTIENGKFKTIHPESFSKYGLGIPCVEFKPMHEIFELISKNEEPLLINYNEMRNCKNNILGIPDVLYYDFNIMGNISSLALKLNRTVNEKEKAIKEKKEIINEFSHTYKNLRATSLYNVATSLLKKDDLELKKYGRQVLLEYGVKKNLTKDVEMLQLRFEDRSEELRKKIYDSVCNKDEQGDNISTVINNALKRCVITLVHDGSEYAKQLRCDFKVNQEFDLISIRNEFEEDILFGNEINVLDWFSKHVFNITQTFSKTWLDINLKEESYASLLLTGLIAELFANIFKYADKSKSVSFDFSESQDILMIKVSNYINKNIIQDSYSGMGLESKEKTLDILNKAGNLDCTAIQVEKTENTFTTIIKLSKALLVKEEN